MGKIPTIERLKIESAIYKVFADGCAAWNRGDLESYLASYWDSEQTIWVSGGALTRGKRAIVASHKARFSTSQQMGKLTVADMEIDVLTPEDAIALGQWSLDLGDSVSKGFFTVQLRNAEGTWFFVRDHSSASK